MVYTSYSDEYEHVEWCWLMIARIS